YPLDMMSFMPIITLEELGFCNKGEGGSFVEGGRIEPGGDFPICTHGGQLSHAHPGSPGPFHAVVEAVRQLRGECGPRQVPKARLALCAGAGAITRSVSILGRL
ncbi:MAG: hypothetical protein Q7R57_07800, partial [Dehalococcoidales bacterium]|nr:hypothetical protein [Dehalococcoidales bacterium]